MEEVKAAMRRPPHSLGGIQISVTTTAGSVALPANWAGQWVQVKCTAGDARILFGGPAVAVDQGASSGDDDYGYPMVSGDKEDWELTNDDTHIAYDSSATGTLEIWLNSGKGN